MEIDALYKIFLENPLVITDSRKVVPGCMFFALKGENFNGNQFALNALEKGASCAVVDDPELQGKDDRLIHTADVLETLQQLALHHRKQLNIPVIAITGTNGKTTTKELTQAILQEKFSTIATVGNLNNHIGVPLTLLTITRETEIAIVEMGANHQGEIKMLCNLALPTHGMITNIGKAHLEGFGGYDGVIRAKTELYSFIRETKGIIFINQDDELLNKHAEGIRRITYGTTTEASVRGNAITADPMLGMEIVLSSPARIQTQLFGAYNATNVLAAACIGRTFGVEDELICKALESYQPVNNRSQVCRTLRNRLFLDAYNANPSSMEQAIRNFAAVPGDRKVYILGDMLELGDESPAEHAQVLNILEEVNAKEVFLVGPVFLEVNRKIEWPGFGDSDLARMWLEHHVISGADILVKGSRGIRMERIVEVL
ncbi:MAG: UDP-N-acetylmuramoyl-tripeptide--D-alanyl-D-alanine ligase [Syntrophothermus sp.]